MDQIRHDVIVKRLDTIISRTVNWHILLLALGLMLWFGYAPGPALLAAWVAEFVISFLVWVANLRVKS